MVRIEVLTSLRGLFALWVVLFHIESFFIGVVSTSVVEAISYGYLAVDLFFILSGFVMFVSYAKNFETLSLEKLIKYVGRRLARIYPLHLVILVMYLVIPLLYLLFDKELPVDKYTVEGFVSSLLLIQNWWYLDELQWNVPAWSISSEFLAYILFPFLCFFVLKRSASIPLLLVVLFTSFAALYYWFSKVVMTELGEGIAQSGTIRCITEFIVGCVLASLYLNYRKIFDSLLFKMALLFGFLLSLSILNKDMTLFVPFVLALFLCIVLTFQRSADLLLLNRPLLFLGEISYAIYISHYLVKDLLKLALPSTIENSVSLILIYLFIVLLFSYLLNKFIEVPSRAYLYRVIGR